MRTLVLFTCAMFAAGQVSAAEEPVNPDEKGIFDFSELDVPKEEEKKAQDTVEKNELQADAALPAGVRRMLDRLTVFEVVESSVMQKRIEPVRAALKDKLLALSDKAGGQTKVDLIALGKYVEGLAPAEVLRPETITLATGSGEGAGVWLHKGKFWIECRPDGTIKAWTPATWRWLNQQRTLLVAEFPGHNLVDVLILSSPTALEAAGFNNRGDRYRATRKTATAGNARKPAAEGLQLVSRTAEAEKALRVQATNEIAKRRAGVARWLLDQAKSAAPASAARILAEARHLNPQPDASHKEDPGRLAGVWLMEDRSKLEFRPGGDVLCSKPGKATWILSTTGNRGTAFIMFGKPDDPADVWVARISSTEPGVLRIYSRDKATSARLQ